MTDNRTTELLDGLRNVGNLHEFAELFGFDWHDDSDWTWHDVAVKMADDFEQAIAATLGSGTCEACYHGYEQAAIEARKSIKTWNTRAEHHVYEQRITGSGSDWGEIMCDAFDSLLESACDACTFDELERFRAYIIKEAGE